MLTGRPSSQVYARQSENGAPWTDVLNPAFGPTMRFRQSVVHCSGDNKTAKRRFCEKFLFPETAHPARV